MKKTMMMIMALVVMMSMTTAALAEDIAFIPAASYEEHKSIAIEENFAMAPINNSAAQNVAPKSVKSRQAVTAQQSAGNNVIPAIIPEIVAENNVTARGYDQMDLAGLQAGLGLGNGEYIMIDEVQIPLSDGLTGVSVQIFSDVETPAPGQQVTLTSFATGEANLSYQWQLNVGNGEWLNILDANGSWYSFKYSEGMSNYSWRLVVDAIAA